MAITPTLSSTGIGSGLDVSSIITKLMQVESIPLTAYDNKTASYQAKLSAIGTLTASIGVFQSSLGSLTKTENFRSITATPADSTILSASASTKAAAGTYSINVKQLAQAQTLTSSGMTSKTSSIGSGSKTTVSFQLGTVGGGTFGVSGTALSGSTLLTGINNGSLSINGTAIPTDSATNNARALAEAINAKSSTTGVTATAKPTVSSATLFSGYGDVSTGADGSYKLSVGGITIMSQDGGVAAGGGITAGGLDTVLAGPNDVSNALEAAKITVSGKAADGTLTFTRADGSNIAIDEVVTGTVEGGIGKTAGSSNTGSSLTVASSVTLASSNASPITIDGSNAAAAGLTAGTGGAYLDSNFTQDATQNTGSLVIDSSNNTLEGIRDAINNAGFGVTASIISDGSGTPYHLVLSSSKTGANSVMKISLSASDGLTPDSAISDLLTYDPAGTQKLSQNTAAQNTSISINGIQITSTSNAIDKAIDGVTLNVTKVGSTTVSVAKDTSTVKTSINTFVDAYNTLNSTIAGLTSYNAETKAGGALLGDSTARAAQSQLRLQLSASITGLTGNLTNLSQIGISFQKDGSLALDSSKLSTAMSENFTDIGGLFAALGKTTDSSVSFTSSTSATKAGTYPLTITNMASQGTLAGSTALAASTTIANDTTWSVTLNDSTPSSAKNTASVTIPAGTYTPTQMASLIQSSINGAKGFSAAGTTVTAAIGTDGKLSVSSSRYGSVSNIAIASVTGSTVDSLFGSSTPTAGTDVAGTIGGQPVVGSGQTLTGAPGSNAEGMKIEVTGGTVGSRGNISFSQGYAYQLNNLATSFLGTDGLLTSRTAGINKTIAQIATDRQKFASSLTDIEARYRKQFTALDVSMSKMQSTSSYLTQQLAAIAANS